MVVEREEWLARRFDVLDDIDVPDLWEQIVGRPTPNRTSMCCDRGRALGPDRRRRGCRPVLVLVGAGLVRVDS